MGFQISYIITDITAKELVVPLGFSLGIETDALPYDEWWVGTYKKNGMTIFWSESYHFANDVSDELLTLSEGQTILTCQVDEDRGHSMAKSYKNGQLEWYVRLEDDMQTIGTMPASFDKLVALAESNQQTDQSVDHLLMVPVILVKEASEFRYDFDLTNRSFTRFFRIDVAESGDEASGEKRSIVSRLFGR